MNNSRELLCLPLTPFRIKRLESKGWMTLFQYLQAKRISPHLQYPWQSEQNGEIRDAIKTSHY